MGRASRFKAIRKAAKELQPMTISKSFNETLQGSELMAKGITKTATGEDINADTFYNFKTQKQVPINHEKEMKKRLNKYGDKGVFSYAAAAIEKSKELKNDVTNTI